MHPDLDKWLNEVWQKRSDIFKGFMQNGRAIHAEDVLRHKGVGRIYKMYTAGDTAGSDGATGDSSAISGFLRDIAKIIEKRQATYEIQDPHWHTVGAEDLVALASGYSLEFDLTPCTADDPDMCVISPESIVYNFIHVRHNINARKAMDQRIYLNLAADGRGAHFAAIVDAVYDHDGFARQRFPALEAQHAMILRSFIWLTKLR